MVEEYAGVLAVPLIMGLVEVAKRLGLDGVWAAPVAVVLGVAIAGGWQVATVYPGAEPWLRALLIGVALGLSASGLYSGGKKLAESE